MDKQADFNQKPVQIENSNRCDCHILISQSVVSSQSATDNGKTTKSETVSSASFMRSCFAFLLCLLLSLSVFNCFVCLRLFLFAFVIRCLFLSPAFLCLLSASFMLSCFAFSNLWQFLLPHSTSSWLLSLLALFLIPNPLRLRFSTYGVTFIPQIVIQSAHCSMLNWRKTLRGPKCVITYH